MTSKVADLLKDLADQEKQYLAIEELSVVGEPACEALLDALDTEDQVLQAGIVETLARIGEPSIRYLIESLGSESQVVQGNSINTLARLGTPAVEALCEAANSTDVRINANSLEALRVMGRIALPILRAKCGPGNTGVNDHLVMLLIEIEPEALISFKETFLDALRSPNQFLAAAATRAALGSGEMGAQLLRSQLGEYSPYAQQNSTNAMIMIGEAAIPSLLDALGDGHSQLAQQNAIRALSEIGESATESLIAASSSNNQVLRQNASAVLSEIKKKGGLFSFFRR